MKKILIVDDQKEIRQLVSVTLESDEYEVMMASNAREALTICAEKTPQVVIMDIRMPGDMDGIAATRVLKSDPATAKCAVIMLSGMGGNTEVENARAAGASGYLIKPFSPLELIEKVEQTIKAM